MTQSKTTQTMNVYNKQFFQNLNTEEGKKFTKMLKNISSEEYTVEITEEFLIKIIDFVNKNCAIDKLIEGHHSKMWSPKSKEDIKGTIETLVTKTDLSLSNFLYNFVQNLVGDMNGGFVFSVHENAQLNCSEYEFVRRNKINFLEKKVEHLLKKKTKSFLLAIEFDYGKIQVPEGITQHILNPEIHQGNNSKSVFYTDDITDFKEYSVDEINGLLKEHYKGTNYSSKYYDKFSLLNIDGITVLMVHLKSTTSEKDIIKHNELYEIICQIREIFDDVPFIMAGDFNLPLPSEDNSHLNLSQKSLENYPLKDEPGYIESIWNYFKSFFQPIEEEYMNRNMTRAVYNPKIVKGKCRSGNPFGNSQAIKGKSYKNRGYNTDQVFVGGLLKNAIMTAKLNDFPSDIMPYISDQEDICESHLSDHQILETTVDEYNVIVFNVLSQCSTTEPPLQLNEDGKTIEYKNMTSQQIACIEDEFLDILQEFYSKITIKSTK